MMEFDTVRELGPEQLQILDALLSSKSHSEAAQRAGISRSTLYRALQEPALQEAYRAARMESLKHAMGRLQQLTDQAVTELEELLMDKRISAHARLKAIELVLTHAIQGSTLEELLTRIEFLEDYYAQTATGA